LYDESMWFKYIRAKTTLLFLLLFFASIGVGTVTLLILQCSDELWCCRCPVCESA